MILCSSGRIPDRPECDDTRHKPSPAVNGTPPPPGGDVTPTTGHVPESWPVAGLSPRPSEVLRADAEYLTGTMPRFVELAPPVDALSCDIIDGATVHDRNRKCRRWRAATAAEALPGPLRPPPPKRDA